jgi:hypothetical protein
LWLSRDKAGALIWGSIPRLSAYFKLKANRFGRRVKVLWHVGKNKLIVRNNYRESNHKIETTIFKQEIQLNQYEDSIQRKLLRAYGGCLGSQRRRRT